jgi:hypothetical protein
MAVLPWRENNESPLLKGGFAISLILTTGYIFLSWGRAFLAERLDGMEKLYCLFGTDKPLFVAG